MTRNKETFNPNRLIFARKRRGLTIMALSTALGITSRTLSDFENSRRVPNDKLIRVPSDKLIKKISEELKFPECSFFLDDLKILERDAVSFRSLARMSASVRDAALSAGQIALEFTSWLDKRFKMPSADLPDLRHYEPEAAAEVLRNEWALGEQPIGDMVQLLEAKGVRVFSLTEQTMDMDAYSFWMDNHPYIFLNTNKSVERSRFDAAHELGHIMLHKHGSPSGKEAERQANCFASALLMPQGSVISRAPRFPSLTELIELKAFWKVSVAALIRRMKDLSLLTEWCYRSLTIELSRMGGLKNEPNPISQRESSKLLPKIFRLLHEDGITKDDIAYELGFFVDDINALIFNLTIHALNGGAINTSSNQNKKTSHLKLIN